MRVRRMRLSEAVRERMLRKGMARRSIDAYVGWVLRFVGFHGRRHPRELGAAEVEQFLTDLAVRLQVGRSHVDSHHFQLSCTAGRTLLTRLTASLGEAVRHGLPTLPPR